MFTYESSKTNSFLHSTFHTLLSPTSPSLSLSGNCIQITETWVYSLLSPYNARA